MDVFPSSGKGGKTSTQVGPLERANLNRSRTRLRTHTDPVSETLCFVVSRMPDEGQCPKTQ
jgi:hypothetical protein